MKHNKKGMELSINFLIVLILSLTVFVGGLVIVRNFFGKAQEYQASIDRDTQAEIERLLTTGSKVAIPMNKKTIRIGKNDVFGLGINNVLATTTTFEVITSFNKAYDEFNKDIVCETNSMNQWTVTENRTYEIKPNENEKVLIPVSVREIASGKNAQKGTYIFNVCVCTPDCGGTTITECTSTSVPANKLYTGKLQKIYIEVP